MAYKEVSVKQPLLLTILPYVSSSSFSPSGKAWCARESFQIRCWHRPPGVRRVHRQTQQPQPRRRHHGDARVDVHSGSLHRVCALARRGYPAGLAMGWFNVVEGLFRPIFELIRPIPPIAWIPLTVFWFGIGLAGKVFIIWIAVSCPASSTPTSACA